MYALQHFAENPLSIHTAVILPTEVSVQGDTYSALRDTLQTFLHIRYSHIHYLIRLLEQATLGDVFIAEQTDRTGVLTIILNNETVAAVGVRLLAAGE
ncbi:MAG: hypothetical protein A2804_00730 [Candidatus Pacebacteria bacterium RIFCSPHIGHO2_01_FULL_46_10]|nr:MAG: hypothetical protein A2804_00730 [Candidatus Pacebacteria bacterium RIFCSPHIGHO2_01_FULL_46_10]